MPQIVYTVSAVFSDEQALSDYVDWLKHGHVAAVVQGGAESGMIVKISEPGSPPSVLTRYLFSSREAFDRYVLTAAPALRADGLRLFGNRGIEFSRSVGEVVEADGARSGPNPRFT